MSHPREPGTPAGYRPTVIVVGAGAAGTLAALHLTRSAGLRGAGLDVVLVDDVDRWGRGVAFGTDHDCHLLNVAAAGMSALPQHPGHFVAWLTQEQEGTGPSTFAPRRVFGRYLDHTLAAARASAPDVGLRHLRDRAVGVHRTESGMRVSLRRGAQVVADAVVLASGLPSPAIDWAPVPLRESAFFVPDPWAPGALDVVARDRLARPGVLLVGTGLTMVDVALALTCHERRHGARPDRVIHAVSRSGRLPAVHGPHPALPVIPDVATWGDTLDQHRQNTRAHIDHVRRSFGDWRPAVDGVRFQLSTLWARLSEGDRLRFLREDVRTWNLLRHRMAPSSHQALARLRTNGLLTVRAGSVAAAEALDGGGLRVQMHDGQSLEVGWVVNCTGPTNDLRAVQEPLLDDLLRPRDGMTLATWATAGMGFRTHQGRLVDSQGESSAPVWALGSLRRGELWESTAVPEIRTQALAVATSVLDTVAPRTRRLADGRNGSGQHAVARTRSPLGLPPHAACEAPPVYNAGGERQLRLVTSAEEHLGAARNPECAG